MSGKGCLDEVWSFLLEKEVGGKVDWDFVVDFTVNARSGNLKLMGAMIWLCQLR